MLDPRSLMAAIFSRSSTSSASSCFAILLLACVAGVQMGWRGEVEFEREARSLGSQRSRVSLRGKAYKQIC